MPLHLTSCVPVREPGFSASECLELARKIESGALIVCSGLIECTGCYNFLDADDAISVSTRDNLGAALRAFAR